MAKASESLELSLSPEEAFARAADLQRFNEWLTLHDGWRSSLPSPDELAVGLQVASVVNVKGTRVRFDWNVDRLDRPRHVLLKGNGKGGVKAKIDLKIRPTGAGSLLDFGIDLGGLPLLGPVGKAAAKAVSGDIRTSLDRFQDLFDN